MESLMDILDKENSEYQELLGLSLQKTPIIVSGNLEALQKITDEEQNVINRIAHLEQLRQENIKDIANVINRDVNTLKLKDLIQMLESRPAERNKLADIYDRLSDTMKRMVRVNEQNRELIQNALEMVEFDMNLIQSLRKAPETANYNKGAYSAGSTVGRTAGRFDARQ
ncbi:MAG: flagellar protein FlgN [Lachnospiraceae bacterium]|nr:flagellar protein FlgN [Lachnospiraceae bacterium]